MRIGLTLLLILVFPACIYGSPCDDEGVTESLSFEVLVPPRLTADDIVGYEERVGRMFVRSDVALVPDEFGLPDSVGVSHYYKGSFADCISMFSTHVVADDVVERSVIHIVKYTDVQTRGDALIDSQFAYDNGNRHSIVYDIRDIVSDKIRLRDDVHVVIDSDEELQLRDDVGRLIVVNVRSNIMSIVTHHRL